VSNEIINKIADLHELIETEENKNLQPINGNKDFHHLKIVSERIKSLTNELRELELSLLENNFQSKRVAI
jgi:hypothetical protein